MGKKVYVVGVGMTNFVKPDSNKDYPEMGKEAVEEALRDASISYDAVQQAVCGYVFGDSTCGQRILYQVGMTGIPIFNTNNHGSTGGSALYLAEQLVKGGVTDVALALGFEKMKLTALTTPSFTDRSYPFERHLDKLMEMVNIEKAPLAVQVFGNAAIEHMKKYGTTETQFAKIAVKNRKNGALNPRAMYKTPYSLEEVLKSKKVFGPLTKLQCCGNSNGAAAAVLMSEKAVIDYGLQGKAIEILGIEMATDTAEIFTENSLMKIAGYDMTAVAAKRLYKNTGVNPIQVNLVELHDCFSSNELITYEALQLCEEGEGGKFVDAGDNTYGGRVVVNPSGGLISKGNPWGATGLAQCAELVWQLRGEAGKRQVSNPRIALQHNLGLGGAVVVALYRKGFDNAPLNLNLNMTHKPEGLTYKYIKLLEKAMQNAKFNLIEKFRGVYGIKVQNGPDGKEGYWVVDARQGKGKIICNSKEPTDVTLTINDEDVGDLISGKFSIQAALALGRIKVQGKVAMIKVISDLQRYIINSHQAKL